MSARPASSRASCAAHSLHRWHSVPVLLICLFLSACAGFRGGEFSAPYVGDADSAIEPPSTPYERGQLEKLELPGLRLDVSLKNRIRTYDYGVMLFVIPMYVDFSDGRGAGERLRVALGITPTLPGYRFDPSRVSISVDGRRFEAVFPSGEGGAQMLDNTGKTYYFRLPFAADLPSPDSAIILDLSDALQNPSLPPVPVIRFRKLRWSEGYT